MLYTFAILTGVISILTFITLWRYDAWWVRGLDFPRLQLGILALLLLLAELALEDFSQPLAWLSSVATFSCVAFQAWWIYPYTPFYPLEVKSASQPNDDDTIAILASNVLTPNRNAPALIRRVRDYQPDILVALETDEWWQTQLDALRDDYPYVMQCPLDNLYGMHVYSRLKLSDARTQFLVEEDVPSMHALVHLRSGQKVQVHFLHPTPPSPTESDESGERDAELLQVAKSVVNAPLPVIVAGDLNDVAWSATTRLFRKISRLLDPRIGRGMFNSFHAKYPFIRWPLDHLFHSDHFVLVEIKRLEPIGSDHFPMFIKLAMAPKRGAEQQGITADRDERQWAEEKINEQQPENVHMPQ